MPTTAEHIGHRILRAMQENNVGPTEVAAHFGVKPPSVNGWTNDGRIAKRHLSKLVTYFGKPLAYWIDGTDAMLCFPAAPIRTSTDKQVREAALWQGGPRGVKPMGHTARVFCDKVNVPVLELRDRSGVVYAREQPETKIGRNLANIMCDYEKTRVDKSLDKVKRY